MVAIINWPEVVTGALLGVLGSLLVWLVKAAHQHYRTSRSLPWARSGIWFSAEFDTKGDVPQNERTTFMRVRMSRTLTGDIRIRCIEPVNDPPKSLSTSWIIEGHVQGDCFLGEWQTLLPGTKRFGVAMLKFLDNSRAVGYWVGLSGYDHPVYGYWLLGKDLDDLKALAEEVLVGHKFTMCDVGYIVSNFDRRGRLTGTKI